jgi:ubiquinone/menaquinone biosynthesis C-methylase UbiE
MLNWFTKNNKTKINDFSQAMKRDWDSRARENAMWYINCFAWNQSAEEFDSTGLVEVERLVLKDHLLAEGLPFASRRFLEIGCGVGRMTKHLSRFFGEVHAVDVSAEMIRQARERLAGFQNVHLQTSSGLNFSMFPDNYFDVIFTVYVLQHVPSREVVLSNIFDACRVLKPGGLFKFQTCGITHTERKNIQKDTWAGVEFPEASIREAAQAVGVQLISILGVETQYCWSIFRKPLKRKKRIAAPAKPGIYFYGRADAPQINAIPVRGEQAFVALMVIGLDNDRSDANNVLIQIGDAELSPCHVGSPYRAYALAAGMRGEQQQADLIQINFPVPAWLTKGKAGCRVRAADGNWSETIMVELIEPPPAAPKIFLIDNAADGGGDVYAHGDKSVFRIFAGHMNETANPDNVRVFLDELEIKPRDVVFVPANNLYMTTVAMPAGVPAGEAEVKIRFNDMLSAGYALQVRG